MFVNLVVKLEILNWCVRDISISDLERGSKGAGDLARVYTVLERLSGVGGLVEGGERSIKDACVLENAVSTKHDWHPRVRCRA